MNAHRPSYGTMTRQRQLTVSGVHLIEMACTYSDRGYADTALAFLALCIGAMSRRWTLSVTGDEKRFRATAAIMFLHGFGIEALLASDEVIELENLCWTCWVQGQSAHARTVDPKSPLRGLTSELHVPDRISEMNQRLLAALLRSPLCQSDMERALND